MSFAFPSCSRVAICAAACGASLIVSAPTLAAQDDFTTWFSPQVRTYGFLDAQLAYSPEASTDQPNEDLDWRQAKLLGLQTVYANPKADVALWGSYQDVRLNTNAQLSFGTDVPNHLRSLRLGATARWVDENWLAGVSLMGQGNGDGPVGDNAQGEQLTGFGQYRFENNWGAWGFLQYEGLVQDDVVVGGGVSYNSKSFNMLLGFPWAKAEWFITEKLLLKGIYYGGPWYADFTWFWAPTWRTGVGLQERVDGFYRRERTVDFYQFQIRQRQADIFLTKEFTGYKYLSVRAGWLFDRLLFEDKPYQDDGANRLEVDSAPVGEVTFSWWF